MKLSVDEGGNIEVREVYNAIKLVNNAEAEPDVMAICMRDGGFEFNYNGAWFYAKNGKVTPRDGVAPAPKYRISQADEKVAYTDYTDSNLVVFRVFKNAPLRVHIATVQGQILLDDINQKYEVLKAIETFWNGSISNA